MRKSRRAQRMEQQNARVRRAPAFNLVALMDIFTILVFFLLVNSSDVQEISAPRAVELPESIADSRPDETPTVVVTQDDILIDGKSVAQVSALLNDDALVIGTLRDALAAGNPQPAGGDRGEITILGDRSIPYQLLKKIMATATDAGYDRISLAVVQKASQGG
jgi:biopolymer transport protein TolR